jgi:hypothetical protein
VSAQRPHREVVRETLELAGMADKGNWVEVTEVAMSRERRRRPATPVTSPPAAPVAEPEPGLAGTADIDKGLLCVRTDPVPDPSPDAEPEPSTDPNAGDANGLLGVTLTFLFDSSCSSALILLSLISRISLCSLALGLVGVAIA